MNVKQFRGYPDLYEATRTPTTRTSRNQTHDDEPAKKNVHRLLAAFGRRIGFVCVFTCAQILFRFKVRFSLPRSMQAFALALLNTVRRSLEMSFKWCSWCCKTLSLLTEGGEDHCLNAKCVTNKLQVNASLAQIITLKAEDELDTFLRSPDSSNNEDEEQLQACLQYEAHSSCKLATDTVRENTTAENQQADAQFSCTREAESVCENVTVTDDKANVQEQQWKACSLHEAANNIARKRARDTQLRSKEQEDPIVTTQPWAPQYLVKRRQKKWR